MSHGDLLTGTENGEMLGYSVAINGDGSFIAVGGPGHQDTGSVWTYSYQEEPVSLYNQLAREIWANATKNSTVDYPWDSTTQCILPPELMANNGVLPSSQPSDMPIGVSPNTTLAPTLSTGTTAVAPTISPMSRISNILSSRLLVDFEFDDAALKFFEIEVHDNMNLSGSIKTDTLLSEEVASLSLRRELVPRAYKAKIGLPETSSGTAVQRAPADYYIALAEGVKTALENNLTSAGVAQALLFQVNTSSFSGCISLLDAAKSLSSLQTIPKDLRAGIEFAIKSYSSRVKNETNFASSSPISLLPTSPTGMPSSSVPVPVTLQPATAKPIIAPTNTTLITLKPTTKGTLESTVLSNSSYTIVPAAFLPILPPKQPTSVPTNVATSAPTSTPTMSPICPPSPPISYNAVKFKIVFRAQGWVGLGVSERGEMTGSIAVIGVPTPEGMPKCLNVMKTVILQLLILTLPCCSLSLRK